MAKFTPAYLKKLEDLLESCGYDVRYEKGNFKSNHCLIEAKKVVVINKFSVLESRIQSLLEIIQTLYAQGVLQADLRSIGLKNPIQTTGTLEMPESNLQEVSVEAGESENGESTPNESSNS